MKNPTLWWFGTGCLVLVSGVDLWLLPSNLNQTALGIMNSVRSSSLLILFLAREQKMDLWKMVKKKKKNIWWAKGQYVNRQKHKKGKNVWMWVSQIKELSMPLAVRAHNDWYLSVFQCLLKSPFRIFVCKENNSICKFLQVQREGSTLAQWWKWKKKVLGWNIGSPGTPPWPHTWRFIERTQRWWLMSSAWSPNSTWINSVYHN